jgi:hypothetical protein
LGNSGTEKKLLPMGLPLSVFDLKPKAYCIKMALVTIAGFSPLRRDPSKGGDSDESAKIRHSQNALFFYLYIILVGRNMEITATS